MVAACVGRLLSIGVLLVRGVIATDEMCVCQETTGLGNRTDVTDHAQPVKYDDDHGVMTFVSDIETHGLLSGLSGTRSNTLECDAAQRAVWWHAVCEWLPPSWFEYICKTEIFYVCQETGAPRRRAKYAGVRQLWPGFRVGHDPQSDGDCFFEAIAAWMISRGYIVGAASEWNQPLREFIAAHLREHQNEGILMFAAREARVSPKQYIWMIEHGLWGGYPEAAILSRAMGCRIVAVNSDSSMTYQVDNGMHTIYLGYWRQHYVLLEAQWWYPLYVRWYGNQGQGLLRGGGGNENLRLRSRSAVRRTNPSTQNPNLRPPLPRRRGLRNEGQDPGESTTGTTSKAGPPSGPPALNPSVAKSGPSTPPAASLPPLPRRRRVEIKQEAVDVGDAGLPGQEAAQGSTSGACGSTGRTGVLAADIPQSGQEPVQSAARDIPQSGQEPLQSAARDDNADDNADDYADDEDSTPVARLDVQRPPLHNPRLPPPVATEIVHIDRARAQQLRALYLHIDRVARTSTVETTAMAAQIARNCMGAGMTHLGRAAMELFATTTPWPIESVDDETRQLALRMIARCRASLGESPLVLPEPPAIDAEAQPTTGPVGLDSQPTAEADSHTQPSTTAPENRATSSTGATTLAGDTKVTKPPFRFRSDIFEKWEASWLQFKNWQEGDDSTRSLYCNACRRWADMQHLLSEKHNSRISYNEHSGAVDDVQVFAELQQRLDAAERQATQAARASASSVYRAGASCHSRELGERAFGCADPLVQTISPTLPFTSTPAPGCSSPSECADEVSSREARHNPWPTMGKHRRARHVDGVSKSAHPPLVWCWLTCDNDDCSTDDQGLTQNGNSSAPIYVGSRFWGVVCASDLMPMQQVERRLPGIAQLFYATSSWYAWRMHEDRCERWDRVVSDSVHISMNITDSMKMTSPKPICHGLELKQFHCKERVMRGGMNDQQRDLWHELHQAVRGLRDAADQLGDAADLVSQRMARITERNRRQNEEERDHQPHRIRDRSRSASPGGRARDDRGNCAQEECEDEDAPAGAAEEESEEEEVDVEAELWDPPFRVRTELRSRRTYAFAYLDRNGHVSDLHHEYARVARRASWGFCLWQNGEPCHGYDELTTLNRHDDLIAATSADPETRPLSAWRRPAPQAAAPAPWQHRGGTPMSVRSKLAKNLIKKSQHCPPNVMVALQLLWPVESKALVELHGTGDDIAVKVNTMLKRHGCMPGRCLWFVSRLLCPLDSFQQPMGTTLVCWRMENTMHGWATDAQYSCREWMMDSLIVASLVATMLII